MIQYNVIKTKHNWKESPDFKLVRPSGTDDYLFLHFKSPVIFKLFDITHCVQPNTCIFLSPGTPHEFYPDNCELVHDWMHFIPSDEDDFLKLNFDINNFFVPESPSFITASIKRCEHELINKDDLYEELVSSEVSGMFIRLRRQLSENVSTNHADALRTLRVYIYRHPDRYSNTNEMAKSVNLSRSRFSIVYKELFKVSPQADLIDARVSKATHLLTLGTLSLTEISEMCGYQSIYHFIRQFRSVTGTTPGAYKKYH